MELEQSNIKNTRKYLLHIAKNLIEYSEEVQVAQFVVFLWHRNLANQNLYLSTPKCTSTLPLHDVSVKWILILLKNKKARKITFYPKPSEY